MYVDVIWFGILWNTFDSMNKIGFIKISKFDEIWYYLDIFNVLFVYLFHKVKRKPNLLVVMLRCISFIICMNKKLDIYILEISTQIC